MGGKIQQWQYTVIKVMQHTLSRYLIVPYSPFLLWWRSAYVVRWDEGVSGEASKGAESGGQHSRERICGRAGSRQAAMHKGTTHVPGRMEQHCARFPHATQVVTWLKTYKLFTSGISRLIFLDSSGLRVRETTESKVELRGTVQHRQNVLVSCHQDSIPDSHSSKNDRFILAHTL